MKDYPLDFSCKGYSEIPFSLITEETTWLVLSYNKIDRIPKEISKVENLERLALNDNYVEEIDPSLADLKNLNWLDLTRNKLSKLPQNLFLFNLLGLGLSENNFEEIPECIFRFIRLRKFGFFYNRIKVISPSIQFLVNLMKLDLSNNSIEELPEEICKLRNLTWLNLSHNKIKRLPNNFGNLTKLEELGLGKNNLEELPNMNDLGQLRILSLFSNKIRNFQIEAFTIKKIDLSNNSLRIFPNCVLNISNLEMVNLKNNKINQILLKNPLSSNLKSIDLSNNLLEFIPFKFIKSIEKCAIINLDNNPFKKPEDIFPQIPSLKELCLSKYSNTGSRAERMVKPKYMCDFCYRMFVYIPVCVYYKAFMENGDSFVLKEELCKSRCYLGSVRCKNEEFNSWINK